MTRRKPIQRSLFAPDPPEQTELFVPERVEWPSPERWTDEWGGADWRRVEARALRPAALN